MNFEKDVRLFQVAGFRQSFAEYQAVFAGFRQGIAGLRQSFAEY